MKSLEITTHIGCPINCRYCPQKTIIKAYHKKSDVKDLSLATFMTCINKLPMQVDIHFTGMCEPWINPQCTDMVTYAFKKGHVVGISTTLQGMSMKDLKALMPYEFKFFAIHLPNDNQTESINIDDGYLMLLSEIVNSGLKVTFHTQGSAYHSKLRKILVDQNVSIYNPHSRAGNVSIHDRSEPYRLKGKIGCSRGLKQNVLMPNGDVLLCCMDYGLKHVIGNLVEMELDSIYRSEAFRDIQSGMLNEKKEILCRLCERYAYPVGIRSKLLNKVLSPMSRKKTPVSK